MAKNFRFGIVVSDGMLTSPKFVQGAKKLWSIVGQSEDKYYFRWDVRAVVFETYFWQ